MPSASPSSRAAAPNRRRQVVDLGVRRRRERVVFEHEPVDDATGAPPREGAGQSRLCVPLQCVPVRRRGAGFGREQQGRADLGGDCAGGERRRDIAPVGDATCGDSWQCGCRCDLSEQCEQGERLPIVVLERALVAAGFRALDDERIDTPGRRLLRLCSRGHRAPDAAAAALEPFDDLALGTAEREGDDLRSLACCDIELGRPVVVRPTRLADGHAVSLRFASHPVDVSLERRLVHVVASRTEDVEADRPRRQRAELLKLSLCGCRRLVARGQEADPPCLGHRRGQSRRRGASCERCAHDRRRQPRRARSRQRFFLRPLLRRTGCTGLPLRRAARFGASGICICWPAASM